MDTSVSRENIYEFGAFRLDPAVPLLLRSGELVPLAPKTLDLLVALLEKGGALISKEELVSAVWPDTFVEESNLTHHVSLLRKTLGNVENGQPYIETISKRGYRFAGTVRKVAGNGHAAYNVTADSPNQPETHEPVNRNLSTVRPVC